MYEVKNKFLQVQITHPPDTDIKNRRNIEKVNEKKKRNSLPALPLEPLELLNVVGYLFIVETRLLEPRGRPRRDVPRPGGLGFTVEP